VQILLGYRTDVTIANTSLLNLGKYIRQLSSGRMKSLPVKFSLSLDDYDNPMTDVVYVTTSKRNAPSGEKYFQSFHPNNMNDPSDGMINEFSGFTIAANKAVFPNYNSFTWEPSITLSISMAYLLRSDLAQLDIISSNINTRPVYYALTVGRVYNGISSYLVNEGLTQRFVPAKTDVKTEFGDEIMPELMFKHLMMVGFSDTATVDRTNAARFITNYRLQFMMVALYYSTNDVAKCRQLLDHCDSLFPYSRWVAEPLVTYEITALYHSKQFEKADQIAGLLMDVYEKQLEEKQSDPMEESEIGQIKQSLKMISDIAGENGHAAIKKRADELSLKF
jgi:hypothetical protein